MATCRWVPAIARRSHLSEGDWAAQRLAATSQPMPLEGQLPHQLPVHTSGRPTTTCESPSIWANIVALRCVCETKFSMPTTQNARRWRPLFYKILTTNMLVFATEEDLMAYIHLTKDSNYCMSLDAQRRSGTFSQPQSVTLTAMKREHH